MRPSPTRRSRSTAPGTSYGLTFDPIANGTTTVTVSAPGYATMTTNGVRTVTVNTPAITVAATNTLGAGLQESQGATLGATQHGGVTATVSSSAPGIVLVSPNATTAGTGSINVNVANGGNSVPFYIQAVEGTTGTAVVTISAPGFISDTLTVTVVPAGIEIISLNASIAAGAANDTDWYVQVGIPNSTNSGLQQVQNVRAGHSGFFVTLTSSNPAVGQLVSDEPVATGPTVTKPIDSNIYYTQRVLNTSSYGLQFDPLAAGTTVVGASATGGVISTTNANRTVTVTP